MRGADDERCRYGVQLRGAALLPGASTALPGWVLLCPGVLGPAAELSQLLSAFCIYRRFCSKLTSFFHLFNHIFTSIKTRKLRCPGVQAV